jgi:cytochrome c heme-lyase
MKRKGYNPPERDINVILAIHNLVNEQGWSKIKEWEAMRGCSEPKLKQFRGRPKDITPKAYFRSFLGYVNYIMIY